MKNAFWNLVTFGLVCVVVYLLYIRGKLDAYLPAEYASTVYLARQAGVTPAETHTPSAPAVATANAAEVPVRRVLDTTPEAGAPAPATNTAPLPPAPEPAAAAPLTVASLTPQQLPHKVKLRKATVFPVVVNGRTAGSMSAPAGMMVDVVRVDGGRLVVRNGEATVTLDPNDTDLMDRARALQGR